MSNGFPEIPRGEPGGIRATAQEFVRAALGVADTTVQLRAGASTMDWYGVAQSQYMASSGRLAEAAWTAGESLDRVAKAIDRYADDLDGAQRELRRLQRIVDDLRQEAASHRATAQGLANTRAHATDPVTVAGLDADISHSTAIAAGADGQADDIVRRAIEVRREFDQAARDAASEINAAGGGPGASPLAAGASPFAASGGVHGGYGVPVGGLQSASGVVPVNKGTPQEIPGYSAYASAMAEQHGETEVGDMTDAFLLAAPGGGIVAGLGRKAVVKVGEEATEAVVGQGARKAIGAASEEIVGASRSVFGRAAEKETRARIAAEREQRIFASKRTSRELQRDADREVKVRAEVEQERRDNAGDLVEAFLGHVGRTKLNLPVGTDETLPWLVRAGRMLPSHIEYTVRVRVAQGRDAVNAVLRRLRHQP